MLLFFKILFKIQNTHTHVILSPTIETLPICHIRFRTPCLSLWRNKTVWLSQSLTTLFFSPQESLFSRTQCSSLLCMVSVTLCTLCWDSDGYVCNESPWHCRESDGLDSQGQRSELLQRRGCSGPGSCGKLQVPGEMRRKQRGPEGGCWVG